VLIRDAPEPDPDTGRAGRISPFLGRVIVEP
jgi:hypothetical protein